jgi:hypothetical protein
MGCPRGILTSKRQALLVTWLRLTHADGAQQITTPGWLQLAKDAFYSISCTALQCTEYN